MEYKQDVRKKLDVDVRMIGPEIARALLDSSKGNRSIRPHWVTMLAKAMRNGEWKVSEPILLDTDGRLIEGHHRMRAVIEYGHPVRFSIMSGFVREEVWDTIDYTSPRGAGDYIGQRGFSNSNRLASTARMILLWEAGNRPPTKHISAKFSPTNGAVIRLVEEDPGVNEAVHFTAARQIRRMLCGSAIPAFLYYMFKKKDETHAKAFFRDLTEGAGLPDGDPVLVLRNRLLGETKREKHYNPDRGQILAWTIKAWNASRKGSKITSLTLRWRDQGEKAEKFPEPI